MRQGFSKNWTNLLKGLSIRSKRSFLTLRKSDKKSFQGLNTLCAKPIKVKLIFHYCAFLEFPEAQVQIYGSMATGLAIDSSDMDILVQGVFNKPKIHCNQPVYVERYEIIEQMKRLFKQLNNLYGLDSIILIETASVPVIKLVSYSLYFELNGEQCIDQ